LIFSNKNDRAKQIIDFIEHYINSTNHVLKDIVKCKHLSGNDSMNKRLEEVKDFEKCEIGIISSARIFGEGVDIKVCDAVCFADGKSSSIDIVQYVGRCLRKCDLIPNKLSYVLIPFILNNETYFFDDESDSYFKLRKILKIIGTTDEMVTEKFVLMDCNNKVQKNIDKSESNIEYNSDAKLDINKFAKDILSKVFDKSGDSIDIVRNMVLYENKKRNKNNEELIVTKSKCIKFLKNNGINDEPKNITNWVKYCLGELLFNTIKNNYYYNIDEFLFACEKVNIICSNTYQNKSSKDPKLPPYEFINNGFYNELNPKFNLDILLSKNIQDNDF